MAGEAAVTKIKIALQAWLTGNIGAGVGVHIDRSIDKPFEESEMPAVNIRVDAVSFEQMNYGSMMHRADVIFDIVSKSAASTSIDASQAEIAASIIARLQASTLSPPAGTIGDLMQNFVPNSFGDPEGNMSDVGIVPMAITVFFQTPEGDHRTIQAHSGQIA
jgi:hypothetical protein